MTLNYVQNDTAPDLTITVKRAGSIVDLTGATVKFKIKDTSTNTRTNDTHNTCTVTAPTTGVAVYGFQTGDLPNAATYLCDVEITYASGKIETGYAAVQINARAEA